MTLAKTVQSDSAATEFQRDGVTLLRGLFSPAQVDEMREAIEEVIASPGPYFANFDRSGKGQFLGEHFVWLHNQRFKDLCLNSVLPDYAAALMDAKEVRLAWDQMFIKEPGTQAESFWHQDQPYAWIDGERNCSFWISLDSVNRESGAVEFVKGSHRGGQWYAPQSFDPNRDYDGGDYPPMPDIEEGRGKEFDIVHYDTEPGDVIAFHLSIIHYAPGNSSTRRRRAISVRYTGEGATFAVRKKGPRLPDIHGLSAGDPIGGALFPKVWPRASA